MFARIIFTFLFALLWTQSVIAQEETKGGFLDAFFGSLFGSSPTMPTDDAAAEAMQEASPAEHAKLDGDPKVIAVLDNFEEAIKQSQLEQRPLLLIAGAEWCGWCRKLEKELELPEAESLLTKWVVVKIDVDESPALAEEFEVSSLPALRVLSADRRVAAKREGYMSLDDLESWLEEAAPQVDPSVTRVLYEAGPPDAEQLAKLIEFLGNRSPSIRQSAMRRLTNTRAESGPSVIEVVKSGRLSQRLCAIDILRNWGAPVGELDPWDPESILNRHINDLSEWLESHPAAATEAEKAEQAPSVDPAVIKETVTRLLQEPESKRRLLLSEAMSYGKAIVPELRVRLENASNMSDVQHTLLKQLLVLGLASEETRGVQADLLTALASLNPETRRKAATKLLEIVKPEDQALVEELVQDVDPLVRESAIPALQRIGLLQQPERLQKLLADKSPSVRTAVLREIAENPDPQSIEILSQHAAQETDEDLLVYTAKTLGELLDEGKSEETLCNLAQHASWRVRAAALDAFGQLAATHYGTSTPVVSSTAFETILKAAEDADPFVKQRAAELMPKLMHASNVKHIVAFLLKRPEQIESFWKEIPEYERQETSETLAKAALRVLDDAEPLQMSHAIALITRVHPESLKRKLPDLLASSEAVVRTAALRGAVGYIESIRREQLLNWASTPRASRSSPAREPWYPVPDSFNTMPALPATNADDPDSAAKGTDAPTDALPGEPAAPIPAELAAVDDFFGGKPATASIPKEANADEPAKPKSAVPADLDLADSLFGGPAKPTANVTEPENDESAAPAVAEALSSWLVRWNTDYAADAGPKELKAIRNQLRQSLSAVDSQELDRVFSADAMQGAPTPQQVETIWLALANLAAGQNEFASKLALPKLLTPLNARPSFQQNSLPVAVQILPWLPREVMFERIKDYQLNWHNDLGDDDKALLTSLTLFENYSVAEWLLRSIGSQKLSNAQFGAVSEYLTRALRGEHYYQNSLQVDTNDLLGDGPFKSNVQHPVSAQSALDWLDQQRKGELTAEQKALLLVQLCAVDYRLAAQSAVGRVASATQWDREVEVATMIALAAEPMVAADRAAQWLNHPLSEVKVAALERLASDSDHSFQNTYPLGIPVIQHDDNQVPLFFFTARPMPLEWLDETTKAADEDIAWNAYMLLISCGKEDLDEWKDDELSSDQLLVIATALAKMKRTDAAAIKFYRRAVDSTEYFQKQALVRVLSGISHDEVKAIKKLAERTNGYSAPF